MDRKVSRKFEMPLENEYTFDKDIDLALQQVSYRPLKDLLKDF